MKGKAMPVRKGSTTWKGWAALLGIAPVMVGLAVLGMTGPRALAEEAAPDELRVVKSLKVGETFTGTSQPAALLTHGEHQYVAYCDADQQIVLAERELGTDEWTHRELPLNVNWNNHASLRLHIDAEGLLHFSGIMHGDPLVYWRTSEPYGSAALAEEGLSHIETLEEINYMVGEAEDRVTYERFIEDDDGRLTFWYRHGGSGDGRRIINVWDPEEKSWSRLLDTPLFDGFGEVNVYPSGPDCGPDGLFHFAYMWRETPDAVTNHHISYVRTPDFEHWETPAGEAVDLPITPDTEGLVVDPTPPEEGLINMRFGVGFDGQDRPVVHYHNYDEDGNSQIYNARWEEDRWEIYQTSDWDWRWDFGGRGAFAPRVGSGPVEPMEDGRLVQSYSHAREGSGTWILDPDTLTPVGELDSPRDFVFPQELRQPDQEFTHEDGSRVGVRWSSDLGSSGEPSVRYYLRYEGLPSNRDRPRDGELPDPSPVVLYKMEEPRE